MNYKIYVHNHVECEIMPTEDSVDDEYVFSTFTEAKKKYLYYLRHERNQWNNEINRGVKMTKKKTDSNWL